jgi:hypothetical protein
MTLAISTPAITVSIGVALGAADWPAWRGQNDSGGTPSRDNLVRTIEEVERVLKELRVLRTEVERLRREVA